MNTYMKTFLSGILAGSMLVSSMMTESGDAVHGAPRQGQLHYYGANLQNVEHATGVRLDGTVNPNGPWPQFTENYCFLAAVQAVVNYTYSIRGLSLPYPHQSDQGPVSGDPRDAQVGQILWDMDQRMIPPDGPLVAKGGGPNRRPFTLGNIAYDFGGDPRIQAFGINYAAHPDEINYHEHIYHTDARTATWGMVKALARYNRPVLVLTNRGLHTLLIAGFWATGNPLTNRRVQIHSLAAFNPWDSAAWGQYITTGPYQRVSLDDWLNATHLPTPFGGTTTLLNLPYASNGGLDPDPSIGIYQAGPGTKNPDKRHWIGNFVSIEPDEHPQSADFAFDEKNRLMLGP